MWDQLTPLGYAYHICCLHDTILFYDAFREQLLSIRLALSCFQAFTDLRLNVGKSEIVLIGRLVI